MQNVTEIENTTQHPITIILRTATNERTAVGTKEFLDDQVVLKPGYNTLTEKQAAGVEEVRKKSPVTARRFDEGQLKLATRAPNRGEIERRIQACGDVETLKRWRDGTRDKALLEIIEHQLAACTVTTDGDIVDAEVKRDQRDPRKGAR